MIFYRADGNSQIGMGHIMRCLSIADAAKKSGENNIFLLSSDDCKDLIVGRGHQISVLHSEYEKMDSEEIIPVLKTYEPRALFIDSYFVTSEYMEAVHDVCREIGCIMTYIDDRYAFPYQCDMLLNYNIIASKEKYVRLYAENPLPFFLLGVSFAPLRKEFQNIVGRDNAKSVISVLVSTGGSDTEHFTLELIKEAAVNRDYVFHFVVGMMNPDRDRIRELSKRTENIVIHENVSNMKELMQSCDVAISAAGSTLYELCATGTPTVTYVLADNQKPGADGFDKKSMIKNCGDIRELGGKQLAQRLIHEITILAQDASERNKRSECMRSMVDGKGALRIMEHVMKKKTIEKGS